MEKRDPSYVVGGNINWYIHREKNSIVAPQNNKKRVATGCSNPKPGHVSRQSCN